MRTGLCPEPHSVGKAKGFGKSSVGRQCLHGSSLLSSCDGPRAYHDEGALMSPATLLSALQSQSTCADGPARKDLGSSRLCHATASVRCRYSNHLRVIWHRVTGFIRERSGHPTPLVSFPNPYEIPKGETHVVPRRLSEPPQVMLLGMYDARMIRFPRGTKRSKQLERFRNFWHTRFGYTCSYGACSTGTAALPSAACS